MKNLSKRARGGRGLLVLLVIGSASTASFGGCGGGGSDTTGGVGGSAGSPATTSMTTTSTTTAATTTTSSQGGGTGVGGLSGGGGVGGTGGTGTTSEGGNMGVGGFGGFDIGGNAPWPTCDTQPVNVPSHTIPEVWALDPAQPAPVWVPGVYVTAVSANGCAAGAACQIFLQQDLTYATIADGSQHSIKLFVSEHTSQYFTTVAVGDQLNVFGNAWRYDIGGQDELLLQVAIGLPGCAKKVGTGTPTPIPGATLEELTVQGYEHDTGPLFVQIQATTGDVHGKPKTPPETFVIFDESVPVEAGVDDLVSLSPYFMSGSAFTGLATDGATRTSFTNGVTGVFGLFVPPMQTPPIDKFKEIYVRSSADYLPVTTSP